MLAKASKDRIGNGPNDGEDVFALSFFASSGFNRKDILEKKVIDEYFPSSGDGVQSESLANSGIDEPITALFPGLSRAEWKKKLELEFEPKQ